jgi:hypothetical protein
MLENVDLAMIVKEMTANQYQMGVVMKAVCHVMVLATTVLQLSIIHLLQLCVMALQ